jgi:hypothetical protein
VSEFNAVAQASPAAPDTTGPGRAEPATTAPAASDDVVQEHLAVLGDLAEHPLSEQADLFGQLHARLQAALSEIDRAG